MVKTCCVYRCSNRATAEARAKNISFFRFPANKRKLQAWIKAVNRKDWRPNQYTCICSDHFVEGWHSEDPRDINYAPTLFIKKSSVAQKEISDLLKEEEAETDQRDVGSGSTPSSNDATTSTDYFTMRVPPYTEIIYPDHLKDHLYCKPLPLPGKRIFKSSPKPKHDFNGRVKPPSKRKHNLNHNIHLMQSSNWSIQTDLEEQLTLEKHFELSLSKHQSDINRQLAAESLLSLPNEQETDISCQLPDISRQLAAESLLLLCQSEPQSYQASVIHDGSAVNTQGTTASSDQTENLHQECDSCL